MEKDLTQIQEQFNSREQGFESNDNSTLVIQEFCDKYSIGIDRAFRRK